MSLFIDYQISSNLLSYDGPDCALPHDKVERLKALVKAVLDAIDEIKNESVEDMIFAASATARNFHDNLVDEDREEECCSVYSNDLAVYLNDYMDDCIADHMDEGGEEEECEMDCPGGMGMFGGEERDVKGEYKEGEAAFASQQRKIEAPAEKDQTTMIDQQERKQNRGNLYAEPDTELDYTAIPKELN
jgi:hypothetical protein